MAAPLERNGINYLFPTIYLWGEKKGKSTWSPFHLITPCSREDLGDWLISLFLNLKLEFQLWCTGAESSSWLRGRGGQQRARVRHHHRGTGRLMDDRRENWTEENGWQLSKRAPFYFFFLMMRETFMALRYSSSCFKSCQRAWEHGSQADPKQDRPGGSRTAGRGFSQATFSCDQAIKKIPLD